MAGMTSVGPWVKAADRKTRLYYCDIVFVADASDGSFVPGQTQTFSGVLTGFEVVPGGTAPGAGMDIAVANDRGVGLIGSTTQGQNVGAGGYFPAVVLNQAAGSAAYETGMIPFSGLLTVTPTGNATNSAVFTFRIWALRL